MEITFDKLSKELEAGKFRPLYLLHGEESYFIDAITKYIENHALNEAERSFNQTVTYGKDTTGDQIIALAQQFPMMGARTVVIVKEAQNLKNLDSIITYSERPVDSTVLVLAHKNKAMNKTTKVYKALKANACVMASNPMRDYQLKKWFPAFLQESHGLSIDASALDLLIEFQGTEIQKLVNEIDKVNIKKDLKRIEIKHVQENIGFGKDFDVFEVQDALANRDKVKLVRVIKYFETVMKTSHLIGIISILYTHFSQAYAVSIAQQRKQASSELGINEWMMNRLRVSIKNYGYKLSTVLEIIREYELKSKGIGSQNTHSAQLLKEMLFKIVNL
ncbi:MAG: DNA polymerase III subunit delta [Bacteroidetes bacterium]|nr:DNA polymerase III subunit delta [Bacteroidota bacterium]